MWCAPVASRSLARSRAPTRNASTPPTPSRPVRSSTSSTTSTAYCFSTGWPERTPATPASATCSGRGAVVPTTLWDQQHCGTNNTVVPTTLWYQQHCGTNNSVVPTTLWHRHQRRCRPRTSTARGRRLKHAPVRVQVPPGALLGLVVDISAHRNRVVRCTGHSGADGRRRLRTERNTLTAMAILRSSNPAFTRGAGFGAPTPGVDELERMYAGSDRLTVDDVVMHTLGLFAVLGIAAGFGWMLTGGGGSVALASGLGALALSFAIGFSRTVRPALIIVFAALEGLFVGGISRIDETAYAGIVAQALLGTGIVFVTMLVAYRSGRLRATPRMRKIVIGTLMGVARS